jgi:hypothetical protein
MKRPRLLVVLASAAFAVTTVCGIEGRAKAEEAHAETSLEAALTVGYVPNKAAVSGAAFAPGPVVPGTPPVPYATGSDSAGTAGFAISGQFTAETPYYGAGIFRAFFLVGGTVFLGRNATSTFATFHPGTQPDTGVTVNRPFAIDLAIGGNFPLCSTPACADLRVFLGMSVVRQSATGFSDETADGGKREESSDSSFKWGSLFGVTFTKPLCSTCTPDSLRLQLGWMARGIPSTALGFTSGTGRVYSLSVGGAFESQLHVGLLLPL